MVTFESDALSKLASKDQLELLDSIDRLRQQGINNYDISLPQIIVCGDQSSGKSSVLEAISGVSFPVKSNLCTRFPTELVLRRTPHTSANVSIVPDPSRGESESSALSGFQEKLTGFASLPDVIEKAKLAMGITTHGKAFSKDLLRVEITGPHHPHLTIVDLPGLIHSETKHQAASDVELIQEVVQSYMEQPRSIILAVVSAKNDFANQVVLKLARKADPTGSRTLGVITKPDTLTPDSESEGLYISLARNQEVEFRLGWHVLMNLDSEKGQGTLADRDAKESEFLSRRVWAELPLASLGIRKLRDRLSKVLLRQIASELPGLIEEIDGKFTACCGQLEKLGKPRATENEQRLYLFHVGQSFQGLVKSSVDASYNDAFFEDAKTKKGYHQRIRAIVQNLNDDFAYDISKMGHYREIYEAEIPFRIISSKGVTAITKNEFLDHIEELMRKTRGRELPGTFNPMIVAELFREQSRPWEDIARRHVERVWKEACNFLHLVIAHIADGSTSNALQQEVFEPAMKQLLHNLREKTTELLKPHQSGHPITYNHYFTETLQSVRRDRLGVKVGVDKILKDFFGLQDLGGVRRLSNMSYDFTDLVQRLSQDREPDMDQFAAKEALDCLNAYYKVALKRFIDDISIQVIEEKLICELGNILSPVSVYGMDSDQVTRVAGESEDSRTLREQLTRQLDVLGKGLEICKRFAGLRVSGDSIFVSSATVFNDLPDSDNHESDTIELTSRLREANRVATSKSVVPTPESPHLSDVVPEVEVVLEEPEPMPVPEAAIEFETKAVGMTDDDFCSGIPTKRSKKKLQKQSIWSPDQ